jgi:riboflavin kinase/FMN adenylyltransferase
MQTFYYPDTPEAAPLAAVTGVFDGVHRGHCAVIAELISCAKNSGLPSAIITYSPHPRKVLRSNSQLSLLSTDMEKEKLLARQNPDYLIVLPFTPDFARLTAAEFLRHYLREQLAVNQLLLGYNQRIGSDGIHDFTLLQQICSPLHINVKQALPAFVDGVAVSSTAIRSALARGNAALASNMLGYRYWLGGSVAHGRGIGRTIGFPTANINLPAEKLLPPDGVYAVWADVCGKRYGGMLNIGANPTINAIEAEMTSMTSPTNMTMQRKIEVHIFEFKQNIYGENIVVHIIERLRDEQKFSSLHSLKLALTHDMLTAQEINNLRGGASL